MTKDWSKIYKKYKGMWVAFAKDETTVLGVGLTVKEAVTNARKNSTETPYLARMPENLNAYVGAL